MCVCVCVCVSVGGLREGEGFIVMHDVWKKKTHQFNKEKNVRGKVHLTHKSVQCSGRKGPTSCKSGCAKNVTGGVRTCGSDGVGSFPNSGEFRGVSELNLVLRESCHDTGNP